MKSRQIRFGLNAGQILVPLLGIAATVLTHIATAAPLDATAQALDLITNTADRNVVSTKGEAESSEINGQIKAQLSGLAAKLADIGVSGTAGIKNDQYQNVLRQDLASTLHDNTQCKLKVFQTLEVKLLPETTHAPPPQINQTPATAQPHDLIAWQDTIGTLSGKSLLGISIGGTITSNTPVDLTGAYITSLITGEKKSLDVETPDPLPKVAHISSINPVPPNAKLILWAKFPGISPNDFIERWGGFLFHAEYAGIKYDKVFSREVVEKSIRRQFPPMEPHVTTKVPP